MLTKDQIMTAQDLPREEVEVPEWGGSVCVRTMTGNERDTFEAVVYAVDGETVQTRRENFRAELCGRCICDENGVRLFSDAEIRDLAAKSAAALDRILPVARRLNGMGREEQKAIEKN